ncbi:MAG: hypothetical protein SP1CHLAM9_10860 [Chlamydiia bacterium]|nr:hypothetical protein [Chlamydiia bacterium]
MRYRVLLLMALWISGASHLSASGIVDKEKVIKKEETKRSELIGKGHTFISVGKCLSFDFPVLCNFKISYQTSINTSKFFQSKSFGCEYTVPLYETNDSLMFRFDFSGLRYWTSDLTSESFFRRYYGIGVSCFFEKLDEDLDKIDVYVVPSIHLNFGIDFGKSDGFVQKVELELDGLNNASQYLCHVFSGYSYYPVFCLSYSVGF